MAQQLTSALAVTFTYTSAGAGADATITISGTPYTVTVATGSSYRVGLAPAATDFARVFLTAINTAVAASGRTFTLTWGSDGRYTLAIDSGTFTDNFNTAPAALVVGFTAAGSAVASHTAEQTPRHCAFLVARQGPWWAPVTPSAYATDTAGTSYGVTSATTTWEGELSAEMMPMDPTYASSLGLGTPVHPNAADLGNLNGHSAGPFSLSDFLRQAGGRTVALAEGNFQTIRTSTSERYSLAAIDAEDLTRPRLEVMDPTWEALWRWTCRMVRQQTPTGTRA